MLQKLDIHSDMTQKPKTGLRNIFIAHTPQVCGTDRELNKDFLGQIDELVVFGTGSSEVAMDLAKEIGIPIIDLYRIHHTEERRRQIHDGYDVIETRSKTTSDDRESETKGTRERPRYREVVDVVNHYMSPSDQLMEKATILTNMGRGECFVRDRRGVRLVQVQRRGDPWVLPTRTKRKMDAFYEEMLNRPEYVSTGDFAQKHWNDYSAWFQQPSECSSPTSTEPESTNSDSPATKRLLDALKRSAKKRDRK